MVFRYFRVNVCEISYFTGNVCRIEDLNYLGPKHRSRPQQHRPCDDSSYTNCYDDGFVSECKRKQHIESNLGRELSDIRVVILPEKIGDQQHDDQLGH